MKNRRKALSRVVALAMVVLTVVLSVRFGCSGRKKRPPATPRDRTLVLVTGYCNCEKCCGWKRPFFGLGKPVYTYGPMKGRPKKVGITASGTKARRGTVAADPRIFPFRTRLSIPGYGIGTVEDIGGAIKGRHIDVWFPTHEEAVKWGKKWLICPKLPSVAFGLRPDGEIWRELQAR